MREKLFLFFYIRALLYIQKNEKNVGLKGVMFTTFEIRDWKTPFRTPFNQLSVRSSRFTSCPSKQRDWVKGRCGYATWHSLISDTHVKIEKVFHDRVRLLPDKSQSDKRVTDFSPGTIQHRTRLWYLAQWNFASNVGNFRHMICDHRRTPTHVRNY